MRRPWLSQRAKLPSAKYMQVEMLDALPAPLTDVRYHPIASFPETGFQCHSTRDREKLRGQIRIVQCTDGLNMLAWDDQQVGRRLRVDVPEHNDTFVLIHSRTGDLSRRDATE